MSHRATAWAWEQEQATDALLLVLLAMAEVADEDDLCYPSNAWLMRRSRKTRRTVQRILRELEAVQLIETVQEGGYVGGERKATTYRLRLGAPPMTQGATHDAPIVVVGLNESKNQQQGGASPVTQGATGDALDLIWSHYVAVMQPRSVALDEETRRVIRDALRVATADECRKAIDGCAASEFHMGKNERRRKYNALSQIIKGKRGGRTTREQIDYFLDVADSSRGGGAQPSAIREKVAREKLNVRTGLAPGATEVHRERGNRAADWLAQHGVSVVRDVTAPDGVRFESSNDGGTTT